MILLSSVGESIFQLIVVLAIFVGVLAITYATTKWLAGYQKSQQTNGNLEVVETIRLTNTKYVQIIRAGKSSYYVIAHGKDEVTLLGTLNEEQLRELDESESECNSIPLAIDFKSVLDKVSKKK